MNDLQRELQEQYNFIGNAIPSLPDEFGMNGADGIGGDPGVSVIRQNDLPCSFWPREEGCD